MIRARAAGLAFAGLVLLTRLAWAQDVGTIAALEGTVEIGRAGAWTAAAIGSGIRAGETVRTRHPGRAQLVFQDDSVISINSDSELRIEQQQFDPEQARFRSALSLAGGKVRAVVSEYYSRTGAAYEITTGTAVASVRGTEFVIAFDPVAEVTEVVGLQGRAAVHSVLDPVARGVFVTARELTTVRRGQFPKPVQALDEATFRQYIEDLDFIGGGRAESQAINNAVLAGGDVPADARAAALSPAAGGAGDALTQVLGPDSVAAPRGSAFDSSRDAGDLLGNSPDVLRNSPAQLGIDF